MSVVIKGMPFPPCCRKCYLEIYLLGLHFCPLAAEEDAITDDYREKGRLPGCKLDEVSDLKWAIDYTDEDGNRVGRTLYWASPPGPPQLPPWEEVPSNSK